MGIACATPARLGAMPWDHFVDVVTTCDRSLDPQSGHHVYKANGSGLCGQWEPPLPRLALGIHAQHHFAAVMTTCDRSLTLENGHAGCKVDGGD